MNDVEIYIDKNKKINELLHVLGVGVREELGKDFTEMCCKIFYQYSLIAIEKAVKNYILEYKGGKILISVLKEKIEYFEAKEKEQEFQKILEKGCVSWVNGVRCGREITDRNKLFCHQCDFQYREEYNFLISGNYFNFFEEDIKKKYGTLDYLEVRKKGIKNPIGFFKDEN